jgi:tetratricopeptide (TPR) repeat protein
VRKRSSIYLLGGLFGLVLLALGSASAQKIADRSTSELLRVAQTLYGQNECFSSRYLYQEVLQREPENVAALAGKGQALVCEGAFEEGISTLEQAAELAPTRGQTHVQLADAHLKAFQGDPQRQETHLENALAALEEAAAAGADAGAVANLRGVVLYRQGNLDEAKTALQRATELESSRAGYHLDLGRVELELGQTEAAVATLRRAVSLEPDSALGHNQLGTAYLLLGRCDDAIFELEQAATLAPDTAEVNFNVARANFDCDKMDAARTFFEKVISLEPTGFPPAYTYLARIDLEANDFNSAVTQATKGALLPPTNAEAYYWLGQTYEARGGESEGVSDADKAKGAYERALELDASFESAQEALDTLERP